eukprot:sb/3469643/
MKTTNFPHSPLALVMSKISIEHLQKQLKELSSINMVLLAQLQNISKNKDSYSKQGTDSDDSCPSSPPRLRRKVLTRRRPVPVFESDSEDDFSPSLVEKSRKRKLKHQLATPTIQNYFFGSQRRRPGNSDSGSDCPGFDFPGPVNLSFVLNTNLNPEDAISSEEDISCTPPERVTVLKRRKLERLNCSKLAIAQHGGPEGGVTSTRYTFLTAAPRLRIFNRGIRKT